MRSRSESCGLPAVLAALELLRSSWHYHQRRKVSYTEKHRDLWGPLEAIACKHQESDPLHANAETEWDPPCDHGRRYADQPGRWPARDPASGGRL
ncbi:MAG: hypothetical protein WC935_07275, partial [Thermoleophilia bacterium]